MKTLAAGTLAATALVTTLATAPAQANDAAVTRQGDCRGVSTWKIKASPDNGRVEIEAEVDSNRVGQTWRWRLWHNGSLSGRGTATTTAPSGSFTVRRIRTDLAGTDTYTFVARQRATGQLCVARVRF